MGTEKELARMGESAKIVSSDQGRGVVGWLVSTGQRDSTKPPDVVGRRRVARTVESSPAIPWPTRTMAVLRLAPTHSQARQRQPPGTQNPAVVSITSVVANKPAANHSTRHDRAALSALRRPWVQPGPSAVIGRFVMWEGGYGGMVIKKK